MGVENNLASLSTVLAGNIFSPLLNGINFPDHVEDILDEHIDIEVSGWNAVRERGKTNPLTLCLPQSPRRQFLVSVTK